MKFYFFYPLYIFFALLPSLLWLNFYLRADKKPEPKSMVWKIFFFGFFITLPAIFFEEIIIRGISKLDFPLFLSLILNLFFGVALVEEFLKFLVVKEKVLRNAEFDEPVDLMIYMIISALGFAAAENLFLLLPLAPFLSLSQIFGISLLRFLGATFLHTLASGIFGFFLSLSFYQKLSRGLFLFGFLSAIFLHFFYNFFLLQLEGIFRIFSLISLLTLAAIFVSFGFKKLKTLESICKI